ncbi:MAG: 16S rRNA (adenine(1518)-N(6)/adenine(1519)-N(6))-dimethyltransferase RsmA [Gammaproteobacteria bacterium]|nr:16S rRNA (adenine(1518)-N(6)/adenine(1519)-N(6))-dimethyltransferase RsmA [Gammaproteobacteria bacterium]
MHVPRKRFGQHFLHDKQVIQRLVNVIAPEPTQHLVEIGPGQGALTLPVLEKTGAMDVIELDRDLIPILTERCQAVGTLTVHQADALAFDFSALVKNDLPLRVIGNLPYNISTPLIFHLLEFAGSIIDMHFMLQKEVVDRLAANCGNSDYGRLSIMVQYHCQVTALFDVPPSAFHPPPKVDSRIVRIVPYQTVPHVAKDYGHFEGLVRQAFSQRRKTLRNCLKRLMTDDAWKKSSIDPKLRPEQLTVADYVKLSNDLIESDNQ